jgi:hypothetical protein
MSIIPPAFLEAVVSASGSHKASGSTTYRMPARKHCSFLQNPLSFFAYMNREQSQARSGRRRQPTSSGERNSQRVVGGFARQLASPVAEGLKNSAANRAEVNRPPRVFARNSTTPLVYLGYSAPFAKAPSVFAYLIRTNYTAARTRSNASRPIES